MRACVQYPVEMIPVFSYTAVLSEHLPGCLSKERSVALLAHEFHIELFASHSGAPF